eukprot:916315_1
MSLTKAIRFRHLITELTNEERAGFLSKLVDSHTDLILASLFEYLTKQNQINAVNDVNKSLSDIIQSRKAKPGAKAAKPKTICTRNIQLHQFPRVIIGYIASFLNQWDYRDFSHCNRSTYLGCNSPNTLQKLDLIELGDDSFINLASFPSVKSLAIDPSRLDNIDFGSQTLNQVSTLRLKAHKKSGWVQSFLNENIVNCDRITTIECANFGCVADRMHKNEFLSLLTVFPNLQDISLTCVHLTNDNTAQDIAKICSKAVGLSLLLGMTWRRRELVKIFANQLQRLTLGRRVNNPYVFDDVEFCNLNELCFMTPRYQSLEGILKSASNLQKISIRFDSNAFSGTLVPSNGFMSNDEIKATITNCIVRCTIMNDMYFVMRSNQFWSVSEGIEYGIFKTKKQPKKQLKMCIKLLQATSGSSAFKADDFVLHVGRMVTVLEASMTNDFMLIFDICFAGNEELNDIFMALCNLSTHTKTFRVEQKIVVTNENCRINGCVGYVGFGVEFTDENVNSTWNI